MFITVSNLFPRPDQPTRGMFNFRLFRSLGTLMGSPAGGLLNICLVPEWRFWRWPEIRRWKAPDQTAVHGPPTSDFRAKTLVPYDLNQSNCGKDLEQKRILEQKVAKAAKEGHVYASGENARVSNQNKSCDSGVFRRCRLRVLCELLFKTLHLGSGYAGLGRTEDLTSKDGRGNSTTEPFPTRYIPVPYLPWVGRSLNEWLYAGALREWAKSVNPGDVVYVPWLYPDGAAVARAIRHRAGRLWLMALGSDTFHLQNRARRRSLLRACADAEGIVCVASLLADRLAVDGVSRTKLHVVPNGVDTTLFRYRDKAELLGCHAAKLLRGHENGRNGLNNLTTEQLSNSRLILFVGNLVPVKGPDVMLRAYAALGEELSSCQVAQLSGKEELLGCQVAQLSGKEELLGCQVAQLSGENPEGSLPSATQQPNNSTTSRVSGATQQPNNSTTSRVSGATQQPNNSTTILLIIGSGPLRRQQVRLARKLGMADRVHFLGNRPHAEVALWMNIADCLCLTSRNEGMPNVVIEALASGLPVVATDVGACRAMLEGEPAARVCRPGDVNDLARALEDLLCRQTDRQAMAQRYAARYSWTRQAEAVLTLVGSRGDS